MGAEYQEAVRAAAENEYIYNLTTCNFGRSVKDYAERLKLLRFAESKRVKEMIVLNQLDNDNKEDLEDKYSDDGGHSNERSCCPIIPLGKRRVRLNRPSNSESPNPSRGGANNTNQDQFASRDVDSIIPDSRAVRKELTRLPPRPKD